MSETFDFSSLLSACATGVEASDNKKIGRASATYVAQGSCPITCPFMGHGCYAENGMTSFTTTRLNKAYTALVAHFGEATPADFARAEASAIDKLTGKHPLRLHVVGDCKDAEAAGIIAEAASRYRAKHGQPVWSYTHAWRYTERAAWGDSVSILASCETIADLDEAHADGYALAMVIEYHENDKPHKLDNGMLGIPCREQVGSAENCTSCKLCFNADVLYKSRAVILFAAHGRVGKVVEALDGRKFENGLDQLME